MNGALAKLLAELRGKDVVALLNRGNRGDGLIHLGGRQLLARLDLPCREYHETDEVGAVRGDVLLVYGAGAMSRGTHTLPRLVSDLARRFRQVIILPASFDLSEPQVRAFARSWDQRYIVFCRELVSFDALRRDGATPKSILLGHDLAFHADLTEWAARPAKGRAGLFRRDIEAAFGRLPANFDVVDDASRGSDREPQLLLDFVARFAEIHTDRCHGAISGAMMGRRVVLYRNSYFKNRAVYDHSLAGMPNVRFVERTPFSFRQFLRATYWGRVRPVEMKVRRVFQRSPSAAMAG
jgi:hypothetical protein